MRISESTIRRRLAKAGYHLHRIWHGAGYVVTDHRCVAVLGATKHYGDATLDDVREFVAGL